MWSALGIQNHLILAPTQSDRWILARKVLQACLGVDGTGWFGKKKKETWYVFLRKRLNVIVHFNLKWPMVGWDTCSTLVPALGPQLKNRPGHARPMFMAVSKMPNMWHSWMTTQFEAFCLNQHVHCSWWLLGVVGALRSARGGTHSCACIMKRYCSAAEKMFFFLSSCLVSTYCCDRVSRYHRSNERPR